MPYTAKYRVKVSAYAIRSEEPILFTIRAGGPGHAEKEDVPKTILGYVDVKTGEPQVFEFEQHLERGQYFRMYPSVLPVIRFDSKDLWGTQSDYTGPGVLVQWVEVEGPILEQWPPVSHERLSFFLWSSLPDAQLRRLADTGQLSQPEVLRQQTERLLNDAKSQRFLANFLGQ